jgi:hypothetical protein
MKERRCYRCHRMGFRVPVGVTRPNTWIFCGSCGAKGPIHEKPIVRCSFGEGGSRCMSGAVS